MMSVLNDVLTVAEVARFWRVTRQSVWYHLNRGHFCWRDTVGGAALIDRQSVIDYWGEVQHDLTVHERLKSNRA